MAYHGFKPAEQAIQIGADEILSSHISDGVIVNADINATAAIATSKISGALTSVAGSHGLATSATTDTTNASNISSGTLAAARVATLNQSTTGQAGTVATIAGLAPNTATTQATQGAITSVGTLTGLTLSGAIVGSNGSASAPSHSFSANTDSGMYSPADNQLGLASGGTLALIFGGDQSATFYGDVEISASGSPSFRVTDTTNTVTGKFQADNSVGKVGTHTNHSFQLFSNNTTALTLDGSQNATFAGNVDFGAGKHIRLGTSFAEAMHSTSAGALNFGTAGTINGRTGDKTLDMGANWYFDVSGYDHVKAEGRSAQLRFHADSANVIQFNVKTSTAINTNISWTNALNITETGYVITPKNPAFSAFFATSWDGSGYLDTNTFTEQFDTTNSMIHGSSARWKYTAPVTGIYFVSMSIMSDSVGSDRLETFIEKNGTTMFAGNATSEDYTNSIISCVIQMDATDYLWFKKSGTQGYTSQNNAHYISVCLIG